MIYQLNLSYRRRTCFRPPEFVSLLHRCEDPPDHDRSSIRERGDEIFIPTFTKEISEHYQRGSRACAKLKARCPGVPLSGDIKDLGLQGYERHDAAGGFGVGYADDADGTGDVGAGGGTDAGSGGDASAEPNLGDSVTLSPGLGGATADGEEGGGDTEDGGDTAVALLSPAPSLSRSLSTFGAPTNPPGAANAAPPTLPDFDLDLSNLKFKIQKHSSGGESPSDLDDDAFHGDPEVHVLDSVHILSTADPAFLSSKEFKLFSKPEQKRLVNLCDKLVGKFTNRYAKVRQVNNPLGAAAKAVISPSLATAGALLPSPAHAGGWKVSQLKTYNLVVDTDFSQDVPENRNTIYRMVANVPGACFQKQVVDFDLIVDEGDVKVRIFDKHKKSEVALAAGRSTGRK